MPKCTQIIHDSRQKTITEFFSKQKGPLAINCKKIITSAENEELKKMYRRLAKKRIQNVDKIDEVQYIKTEEIFSDDACVAMNMNQRPPSPNIILRTELGCTSYLSTSNGASTNTYWKTSMHETSPSKKQKVEITGELTITKSQPQKREIQNKVSRTFQMTQSKILGTNLNQTESVPVPSWCNIEVKQENIDIGNFLQTEVMEENENLHRMTNHISLINEVIENSLKTHLSTLLFDDEKCILEEFQQLTIYQKYLCCKLFTHQIKWYNARKFAENIKLLITELEIKQIISFLNGKNIINLDYSSELTLCLLESLNVNHVKNIHDALRLKTKEKKKPALIQAILQYINCQATLHPTVSLDQKVRQMISKKLGDLIHITPLFYTALYKVHLLYTYTNPEFDIPSGLYLRMSNIKNGSVSLPDYECTNEVVFENAEAFADFYKAFSYKSEVLQATERKGDKKFRDMYNLSKEIVKEFTDVLAKVDQCDVKNKPKYLHRFSAGDQYASSLWVLCKHLGAKHHREVREWLEILLGQTNFCQTKRGLWYSHLSVIYKAHLSEGTKAIETLIQGLKDETVSLVGRSEIVYRAKSYNRCKKLYTEELSGLLTSFAETMPNADTFPSINIKALANNSSETMRDGHYKYVDRNGDVKYMNVEEIAIRHYRDEKGFPKGVHCEGSLIQLIFHILFWDIIYTKGIPYGFICKMQQYPLDFYSEEFYKNRKTEIDERLSDIKFDWSAEYLRSYVIETWNSISNFISVYVPDVITNGEILHNIISNCIGRAIVSDICKRLVQNMRDYRAGMPDLFVYNENSCKFVEVKGPGDTLSSKQKLWITYLLSISAKAEVCYVLKVGRNK